MTEHQASRAEHQPPVAVPPDQTAGGLLAQMSVRVSSVLVDASTLQGDLERLAVLLAERGASLEQCALIPCPEWRQNRSDCIVWAEKPCGPCLARKACGKGAS